VSVSPLKVLPFDQILGQERALTILSRALEGGRVSHAYLFVGPEGVGRETVALSFFWYLVCEKKQACGECRPCLKFLKGLHPDFHILEPSGKSIKIEQIRNLEAKLQLHPVESKYRLILLPAAETLTREAANALLKSLEEPPPQTIFVLIAQTPESLLPTIVSRCQLLRFRPLPPSLIEKLLTSRFDKLPEEAKGLALLCEGSIGRALRLSEKGLLEELHRFTVAVSKAEPAQIVTMAETLAGLKDDLALLVELILLWLRQALLSYLGLGDYPKMLPLRPPKDFIIPACGEIEKTFQVLEGNLNLELFFLKLLNTLARLWQETEQAEVSPGGTRAA